MISAHLELLCVNYIVERPCFQIFLDKGSAKLLTARTADKEAPESNQSPLKSVVEA